MTAEQSNQCLAIYGAVVGTMALGINLFNFLHTKRKDAVRLSIECHEDEHALENIDSLVNTESNPDYARRSLASVYAVTVRNIGNTEAHIQEVGITDESGVLHTALVAASHANLQIVLPIARSEPISIKPKAMHRFTIYLQREEKVFTAVNCFVIDQQQRRWKSRLKLPRLNRHLKTVKP